jgi:hypothetical protein
VSFHSSKLVKKVKVSTKVNDIVNRLNRSRKELNPDLCAEKDAYDREVNHDCRYLWEAFDFEHTSCACLFTRWA